MICIIHSLNSPTFYETLRDDHPLNGLIIIKNSFSSDFNDFVLHTISSILDEKQKSFNNSPFKLYDSAYNSVWGR